jgi:putative acetyltransferase
VTACSFDRKHELADERAMMRIVQGDFDDPQVIELLQIHLTSARAETAPGSAHALDVSGLQSWDISFWTIWENEMLMGIGALKQLSPDHGEIKSMHTAQFARARGIGSAMLLHLVAIARASGISRLSLETGSWEYFRPARELYRKHGFVECPPFGDYILDPNSVFMTLDLRESRTR